LFHDVERFCKEFEGPIEVVWGIKDPILGKSLKSVRKILKKANFTELDAGHFLQEECPLEIAEAILRGMHQHQDKDSSNNR
jgi:pimeloyl-ACP methyl ester carboxylesterase